MFHFKYRLLATALLLALPLAGCGEAGNEDQQSVYFNEVTPDDLDERGQISAIHLNKLLNTIPWTQRDYPNPTIAGHYLAGRFAAARDDLDMADKHMYKALSLDPENAYLIQRTFPSSLGSGNIKNALSLAEKTAGGNPVIAHLGFSLLIADAFKAQDFEKAQTSLDRLEVSNFGHYLKPITQAWIYAANGQTDESLALMKQQIQEYPSLKALYYSHMAMVYDYNDQIEEAAKYYRKSLDEHFSARTAWLAGALFERTNQLDQAKLIYQELQENYPQTTFTSLALARIAQGKIKEKLRKVEPRDGVMSGLFDLASVLQQEGSARLALLYGQVASYLVPDDPFLVLLMGDIEYQSNNLTNALNSYKMIKPQSDFYVMSQIRLAKVYEEEGELDKAITILEKLSDNADVSENILMNLGDLLRRNEQFDRAIPYYTKVIDSFDGQFTADHWELFYARGVAYEQKGDWPKAEADLKQALILEPNQPYVLNYLGYSWADQGIHIDLALDYIQKAVQARPNDGYIIDSMGWVLYKLERYEEAVLFLEQAVAQVPGDPIINDHLGDAYWQVGRRLEAGFQWQRALDNSEDPEQIAEIETKLIEGLSSNTAFIEGKPVASKSTEGAVIEKTDN